MAPIFSTGVYAQGTGQNLGNIFTFESLKLGGKDGQDIQK